MNKRIILMLIVASLFAFSAFAQAPPPYAPLSGTSQQGVRWGLVSAAFVLGIAAAAGAIGQGRAIAAAVEGIARNPTAAGPIRLNMLIGLALIESLVIYALVVSLIMAFRGAFARSFEGKARLRPGLFFGGTSIAESPFDGGST